MPILDEEGTLDTTATGAQLQPDDAAAIRAFIAPWSQAAVDRDWDALLAMCTDDIVFSPPEEPKVSGSGLRPWLEAYPVIKEFNWGFDEIQVSGDLAIGVGWGELTLEIEGQEASLNFKFADTFRRGDEPTPSKPLLTPRGAIIGQTTHYVSLRPLAIESPEWSATRDDA